MSRHPDPGFDLRIADWLEADPDFAPPDVMRTVESAIPSIAQRRAWRPSWRTKPMTRLVILGASVALLAALGIGAWTVGSRPQTPAPTPIPTVPAAVASSPTASPAGAIDGYVAARNAVCEAATAAAAPIKARFDPLYTAGAPEAERADAILAIREFADVADGFIAQLDEIVPPPDLTAAHAANVAHYQDVLILIRTSLDLHDQGRTSEAIAVDLATDDISALIDEFETMDGLVPCP
jgi:hypothetical protein